MFHFEHQTQSLDEFVRPRLVCLVYNQYVTDFEQPGKVYYGEVTLHEVLERTGWGIVLVALSPLIAMLLLAALAAGGRAFIGERWARLRGHVRDG